MSKALPGFFQTEAKLQRDNASVGGSLPSVPTSLLCFQPPYCVILIQQGIFISPATHESKAAVCGSYYSSSASKACGLTTAGVCSLVSVIEKFTAFLGNVPDPKLPTIPSIFSLHFLICSWFRAPA